MSPRHRILLGDRIRRDVHAAVCAAFPEHKDDTLEHVAIALTGDGYIIVSYKGEVVRRLRLGDLEVDDEPLDVPVRLTQAGYR